jgi:tryptophanyl-tRNA synthetase
MQSVVTQMADILYPQLDEPKPTVIPVGPDQDPHMRLTRDLAARMRFFKVTEAYASFESDPDVHEVVGHVYEVLRQEANNRGINTVRCGWAAQYLDEDDLDAVSWNIDDMPEKRVVESTTGLAPEQEAANQLRIAGKEPLRPRVRFLDRNATDDAFEALIAAVDGEKRVFDEHVDAFDLSREAAEALAREIEVEHGGYGFLPPSSVYHRFMTGLTGGKMSSSVPASHISLLDDPGEGYEKVKAATTGGRETAELQRELGGEPDDCPVYELYAYLLAADDDEFATRVYEECAGGERLCGDCKEQAARLMEEFLADHQEKRAEVASVLEGLDIELESPRRRE